MIVGDLNAQYIRSTYLRGIALGSSWVGPSADAALEALMETELEVLSSRIGVQLCRRHVKTMPAATLVYGRDFDVDGEPIPYMPPDEATQVYRLLLPFPHVQLIDQVRLFDGYDLSAQPVFETIPLEQTELSPLDNNLRIPASAVVAPELAQAWAIDYTLGLGRIPIEVMQWVALGVAIQVLSIAGQGKDLSAGLSSWSLTQDGSTEMQVYGGKGQEYGLYTGTITALIQQRDLIDLGRLRFHYQGLHFATVR